ncbi:FtsJ-domain-containing protein [Acrodontium crateriforme]|uniref:rRNA methyltransferase 2, mitochondrial n=1 Tax=Acrodontium crateriforme TaxID=150365 RepID=A0AAQ3M3F9_9PEZI|nr:FtsJ-domain-containing protein [Acrodontium crateriforme]
MLASVVKRLPVAALRNSTCEARYLSRLLCLPAIHSNQPRYLGPNRSIALSGSDFQHECKRHASSSSSTRWKARQKVDSYAREAKVAGLKSRAAYKLLEINEKHRLFRRGDTVVDLGFAPGSWSQVAANRTSPGGRVIGIDVIPAQPPKGVSTLQGDFLSPEIREEVRKFVQDPMRGRPRTLSQIARRGAADEDGLDEDQLAAESIGYVELERHDDDDTTMYKTPKRKEGAPPSQREVDDAEGRVVNVVLSDMSDPWPLTSSTWVKSVSNPYSRMMNTSGMAFRDHAGSMDLCLAALEFCYDTLATGGHFLTKFYQGAEDHAFEMKLKKLFEKVHRIKPDSSRKESKEAYFIGLRRKANVARDSVFNAQ